MDGFAPPRILATLENDGEGGRKGLEDGGLTCCRLADLRPGCIEKVLEIRHLAPEAGFLFAIHDGREVGALGDETQAGGEAVDTSDGGKGVVDSRRKGAECDFDELAEAVFEVLRDGSATSDDESEFQSEFGEIFLVIDAFDSKEPTALRDEVACGGLDHDLRVEFGRDAEKLVVIDSTEVAFDVRANDDLLLRVGWVWALSLRVRRFLRFLREQAFDHLLGFLRDARNEFVCLNAGRDMMDEEDEGGDADEHEDERDCDREVRHEQGVFESPANRLQDRDAIDEDREENSEHELVCRVAAEVVQQARAELA